MFERNYGSSGSGSRGSSGGYNSGPREMNRCNMFRVRETDQVPFKPDGTRPVYCGECYTKHRPARSSRF